MANLGLCFFCHVNSLWIGRNNPFFQVEILWMFRQKKRKKEKEKEAHVPGGPCKQKRENQRERERKKSREIEREALGVVVKQKKSKLIFSCTKEKGKNVRKKSCCR
jgi:hypothetical protein